MQVFLSEKHSVADIFRKRLLTLDFQLKIMLGLGHAGIAEKIFLIGSFSATFNTTARHRVPFIKKESEASHEVRIKASRLGPFMGAIPVAPGPCPLFR